MSENPEERTLQLLRETRAELVARFDGIDHRLHWIEQRLGTAPPDAPPATAGAPNPRTETDREIGPHVPR